MTSISTCPACQGEYRSYEYPVKEDGLDFMVHVGRCHNCGYTFKEIPEGLTEAAFQRRERNRLLMEEANGKSVEDFLNSHPLSEYPYFNVTDKDGQRFEAFTYDEAVHIGRYLYDPGEIFTIKRLGMTVKAEFVPKNADNITLRVEYVIPVGKHSMDGFRFIHRFGCSDMNEVQKLISATRPRGVFFAYSVS